MFTPLDISLQGLQANRLRLETISTNVAGMVITREDRGPDGQAIPYRRRTVRFESILDRQTNRIKGVRPIIEKDHQTPFKEVYSPGHVDADPKTGILKLANVDHLTEQVNAIMAQRSFEANVQVMNITKTMLNAGIRLIA